MGWIMTRKHPEFERRAASLDCSDLMTDPVVAFQVKHYHVLYLVFSILIPVLTPCYLWNVNVIDSFFVSYVIRYMTSLHNTWFVNSAAHMFGTKPYNSKIEPRQNVLVAFVALGEGYHNFHHVFPWDYRSNETGSYLNTTKGFIDLMAFIGQAYNMKTASPAIIEQRFNSNAKAPDMVLDTESHHSSSHDEEEFCLDQYEYERSSRSL
jgi:stearoyl-CoA desaturase (delta-9 desaturase)